MYLIPDYLGFWNLFIQCPEESGGKYVCLGISAVYRMCLSLVLLHFTILLCLLPRNQFSMFINEKFWFMKSVFVFGVFGALLYVNNQKIEIFVEISKYLSFAFFLFQIIMLIDLFYLFGEKLAAQYDQGKKHCAYVMISLSLILYGTAIYL